MPEETEKELQEKAIDIFGREEYNKMIEEGRSILDYIIEPAGSFRFVPDRCDRCKKRFRLWRKKHGILSSKRSDIVCKDCIIDGEKFHKW